MWLHVISCLPPANRFALIYKCLDIPYQIQFFCAHPTASMMPLMHTFFGRQQHPFHLLNAARLDRPTDCLPVTALVGSFPCRRPNDSSPGPGFVHNSIGERASHSECGRINHSCRRAARDWVPLVTATTYTILYIVGAFGCKTTTYKANLGQTST